MFECSTAESVTSEDLTVTCTHRTRAGSVVKGRQLDWSFLFVAVFIVAGGLGNILVCLAVGLDKRLHNVTNYFLLSLAVADLLVSLFVMPLGAIPGFLGNLLNVFKGYYVINLGKRLCRRAHLLSDFLGPFYIYKIFITTKMN